MIGIYKITNNINDKCYIGQSRDIKKRWVSHKNAPFNPNLKEYNYPLYQAIRKYGLENFSFEVLEECQVESLNEKEDFWIKKYNSIDSSYGYNQTLLNFHQHGFKLTEEQVESITKDLKESITMLEQEIAEKYGVSIHSIKDINVGRTWKRDNVEYPIRDNKTKKKYFCQYCGKEVSNGNNRCKQCYDKAQRKVEWPDKETLYNLLKKNSFCAVGRMYGVSDKAIRKWCEKYGLPTHARDYK